MQDFNNFCSSSGVGKDTTTNTDLDTYAKKIKNKIF